MFNVAFFVNVINGCPAGEAHELLVCCPKQIADPERLTTKALGRGKFTNGENSTSVSFEGVSLHNSLSHYTQPSKCKGCT